MVQGGISTFNQKAADAVQRNTKFRYANSLDVFLLVLGIVLAIVQGCCTASNTILFRKLTDVLIHGQESWSNGTFDNQKFQEDALNVIHYYFLFGVTVFFLSFCSMCCWNTFCERQVHKIRQAYFTALLRQNWEWYDLNDSGTVTTRMSDGLDRVRDGLGDKIGTVISYITHFFGGIGIAFYYSPWMTMITLACAPFFISPLIASHFFMSKLIPKEMKAYESAGSVAEEVINGIKTVNSFGAEQKESERYSKFLSEGMHWGLRRAFFTTFGTSFITFSMFASMAISFWVGTGLVLDGRITEGTVFAVFWAVNGAIFFLAQAIPLLPAFFACYSAASPIFQIIDRIVLIDGTSDKGSTLWKVKGKVKFENVWFRYPTRPKVNVLKGVSLYANPGENIALVGHSGSGKSTMATLLMHFYELNDGRITIDDTNIEKLNLFHLRNIVGIVSQEPTLFADTVENNIRLGAPDIDDNEVEYYCKLANAHDFIEQLPNGYKTVIGTGGVELSGGQQQRIAIARTLARKPAILLLDEATSALDSESESLVQAALERAKEGRTTITIAHRLSTIRNCNRIYVFDNGSIAEVGSHEELMRDDGHYAKMVRSQEIEMENSQESTVEESTRSGRDSTIETELSRKKVSRRMSRSFSLASEQLLSDIYPVQTEEEDQERSSNFLEILQFAKPLWILLVVAILTSILRGFNNPIFSILYGRIFRILSAGTKEEKSESSNTNAIYFLLLATFAGSVTMISGYSVGQAGERLTKRLRILLFENILRQDGEYFDVPEHSPGRLTTRLATDAPNMRAAIDQRLADVVQGISAIICGTAIAFWFSSIMAPIGIFNVGVLMALQALIAHILRKRGIKDAVRAEEPSRLAIEAVEQYRTVQYLAREKDFVKKFADGMHPIHVRNLRRGILQALSFSLTTSYTYFNFVIGYRYGVMLIKYGIINPFTAFQVIESLNSASPSLLAFGTYLPEYARARCSAGLMFQMLREKPKIDNNSIFGKKIMLNGDVVLNNVYFGYQVSGRKMILKDFSLKIENGKTTAIVGASGCGKSTTIQLLERFYDPIAGNINYGSVNLRDLNLKHLRSQVALVGQQPTLFNYSIKENIAYGLESVTEEEIIEAAKLAHAHEFITRMPEGYDTIVGEGGNKLSGGQKQRIAIARAVIRNPRILLLDEATSALDVESEKLVQEALERAKEGRTCVVIAHRLTTIRGADSIAVVKNGAIVEQGSHSQLLALDGEYAHFVQKASL